MVKLVQLWLGTIIATTVGCGPAGARARARHSSHELLGRAGYGAPHICKAAALRAAQRRERSVVTHNNVGLGGQG